MKRLPVYVVADTSWGTSDLVPVLEAGLRSFVHRLRDRAGVRVAPWLSLLTADELSPLAAPLTEAAHVVIPSLGRRSPCVLGRALDTLFVSLPVGLDVGKPLVIILLASSPTDAWTGAADRLRTLAAEGKVNVFAFGLGSFADATVLRRLTPVPPLALPAVTPANVEQLFEWLYGIADVMLTGMESGASGQRNVLPPPPCLRQVT